MQKYKMPISRLRMMVCLIGMLLPMCMFAQQITVQGVVKDQTGETVIGASVMEKGTTNGTITGIDGDFSLNMSPNGTLVVLFVGYKTQEVQVKGQKQLQVVLSEDAEMLDEVVVIGYGTMKKSDLTGAVSSIGNKDIKDSPVSNLGQAIQGKISGVQIVDAGKPGDNVSIKIRGLGSINNCDPLVVIDGVPTDLGLSSLNMADVERLDVLKDASATAIYGSRGANGVVMITTKRGTEGKGKLAVSANYSFQNATNVPSLLNAAQYAELSNDMMVNSGRNPNPEWANPSELGAGTDWMDELLRTGVMQNYTVSYSGGNEKSHYYVSGGFLDQSGIVKSVNYRRFTFQSNSDAQVLKWLKFSNNITFSADTKKSGSYNIGDALKALPIYPVKNEDGSWSGPDGNSEWYGSTRNPIGPTELNKSQTDGYNFLANLTAELTFTKWLKFKSTFGYDAKFWFIDNFTPKYNWKPTPTEETSRYKSDNKSFTYLWDNYFLFDHTFAEKHRVGLMAGMSAQWNTNDYLNAQKNVFMFDNVHEMDNGEEMYAIGGNETEWALLSYMARVNYSYEDRYLLTATIRRDGSSRFAKESRWGNFGSLGANWVFSNEEFMKKYRWLNQGKLRASWGQVGNDSGSGYYAYYGLYGSWTQNSKPAYVVSQNPARDLHWETGESWGAAVEGRLFNRLNLSVEYFDKRNKDLIFSVYAPSSAGGTSTGSSTSTTDRNIGTISNRGWEISADFDIVKSKDWTVSVSANLTTTKNKIVKLPEQNKKKTVYPIDPSGKLGQREDLPVGITSGSYLISEGKSRYDYYTYHWAGVDEMDGQSLYEANLNDYYIVLPDGSQLGGKQKLNDEGELMWDANGNPVQGATELAPENYRLINGKYYVLKTTYAQKKWAGSALPTTYGSFSANIRWKNINISAMFTYSLGGKIYDSPYSSLMTPGQSAGNYHVDLYNNAWRINDRSNAMITTYKNAYDDAYNAAIAAGQTTSEANYAGYYAANKAVDGNGRINPNTNPEINNLTSTDNNAGSDRWLVSRNYLCFKNLNISYTLPKRWTAKVNLSTVRFLFSAENIHLWSARKGMNPMMGIGGGQSNYLVPARVFTFGINATI